MEKNVRQIRIPTKRELLHQIYPGNDEMSAGPYSNHLRLRLCVGYSLTLLQVWIMFDEVMSSPPLLLQLKFEIIIQYVSGLYTSSPIFRHQFLISQR